MISLSIIVPVYNTEKYLTRCLLSLEKLNNKSLEFIIVDDGSTDNSCTIIRDFEDRDQRFICIRKKNGGVSSARNIGLETAKGEYVLFLDSDDELSYNILDALAICEKRNVSFLVLRRFYLTRQCAEYNYVLSEDTFSKVDEKLYLILNPVTLLMKKFFLSGSAEVLVRRELLKGLRFDPELNLLEDLDFFLRVLEKNSFNVFLYDNITTRLNDEVENSLTKKKGTLRTCVPGTLCENPYLKKHKKLYKKLLWFEVYFHSKKLGYKDRIIYFYKYRKMLASNWLVCKYQIGACVLLLLNLDINRIRIKLKNYMSIFR